MTNWVVRFTDDKNRSREEVERLIARLIEPVFRVQSLGRPLAGNPQPLRVIPPQEE